MSLELRFTVYVGAQALTHIDNVRIERSLENFAYGFSCILMPTNVDFQAGDKVQVFWDEQKLGKHKDPIFCGYIDHVNLQLSGSGYSATFSARSYALDLIDSVDSLQGIDGEISDVVEKVCQKYSVPFSNTAGQSLGKVRFACENESPFRILNDLAKARGAMLITNGWGSLELAKVKSDILNNNEVFGLSNIIDLEYTQDLSQCYHKYKGVIAATEYQETDNRIRKSRVLQIPTDGESIGLLRSQLKNERNRRYGMSQKIKLSIQGWQISNGKTHWYENSNILIEMPELGIQKRSFFVYAVALSLSKYGGYRAELSCCNKAAFDLKTRPSENLAAKPQTKQTMVTMSNLEKQKNNNKPKFDGKGQVRGL